MTDQQSPEEGKTEPEAKAPEALKAQDDKPEPPKAAKVKPAVAPSGSIPSGARGEWVKPIQERLGVEPTGVVDKPTAVATRAFQRMSGLPMTGRLDVATRRALGV